MAGRGGLLPEREVSTLAAGGRRRTPTVRCAALVLVLVVSVTGCGGKGSSSKSSSKTTPSDKLLQQGLSAQGAGRLDEARQDYEQAIAKDPTNKFAYYNLGVIYQQLNDVKDATDAYNNALKIDSGYKPALFNLAILLTPIDPQQAIVLYRKLLTIDNEDANVHFNLGLLLKAQGQVDAGNAEIATALRINPSLSSRIPPSTTTAPSTQPAATSTTKK